MAEVIHLDVRAEISKERSRDYQWQSFSGATDAEADRLARCWLTALEEFSSHNPMLTILQRVGPSWWLMNVRRTGADDRGRPKVAAQVGRLGDVPLCRAVPPLLAAFAVACRPPGIRGLTHLEVTPLAQEKQTRWDEVARVSLYLSVGCNATVANGPEVGEVLDDRSGRGVGLSALRWVALVPATLPEHVPDGPGLFLTSKPQEAHWLPRQVADCFGLTTHQVEDPRLRLPELGRLPLASAVKVQLFEVGRNGRPLPEGLPVEALAWLSEVEKSCLPRARSVAFQAVTQEQLLPFLEKITWAVPDELRAFGSWLKPEHREVVCRLLKQGHSRTGCTRLFSAYHQLFPDDPNPRRDLLSSHEEIAWDNLCSEQPHSQAQDRVLEGLLTGLPGQLVKAWCHLPGLAWAAESGDKTARQLFRDRLLDVKFPCLAVQVLCDARTEANATEQMNPPLQPAKEWLRGVGQSGANCLLQSEALFVRSWWLGAIGVLFDLGRLRPEHVCVRGINRRDAELVRLARAPLHLEQLVNKNGPRVRLPVRGERWPDWTHALTRSFLAALVKSGELWRRLEAPLHRDQVNWLLDNLDEPLAGEYEELFGKVDRHERIAAVKLVQLAGLLPGEALLAQLMHLHQAQRGGEVPSNDLCDVLEQDILSEDRRSWLRAWLLTLDPLPPDPEWTDAEAAVLYPHLPGGHERLLRAAFSRRGDGEPKRLLEKIEKVLRSLPPALRPIVPPPTAAQQANRPGWREHLAELLGWDGTGLARRGGQQPVRSTR